MAHDFVWFELITPDTAGAAAFYKAVMGWNTEVTPGLQGEYTLFKVGEMGVGGMMAMRGVPPGWMGYVGVDDVDAYARKVEAAGGAIHKGPQDIPEVGRFAVVADPQGAVFILFKGSLDQPPPRPAPMSPGSLGWSELHAASGEKAFAFYSEIFGWTKHQAMPMGDQGVYQTFGGPEAAFGGMMSGHDPLPMPYWLYYFAVENIDAAAERVKAAGGQVLLEPMEVPGGAFVINGQDPQGGLFALVGMRG